MAYRLLAEAIACAGRAGRVLFGIADQEGLPHLTIAWDVNGAGGNRVRLRSHLRRQIIGTLKPSRGIVLIIWDTGRNKGYELVGHLEDIQYRGLGAEPLSGEIETEVLVRIEKVGGLSENAQGGGPEGDDQS